MKQNKDDLNHSNVFGESVILSQTELKAYEKPVLVSYGDVRDITLGPTVGEGESGCAFFFRNGPGGC